MSIANYLILLILLNYRWIATLATMLEGNSLDVTTQKILGLGVIVGMVVLMLGMALLYSKGKNNPKSVKPKWWHYGIFVAVFYLSSYAALTNYYIQISAFFSIVILVFMIRQIFKKSD